MVQEIIWRLLVSVLWIAWIVYWVVSARDVKPTRSPEPLASRLQHRVPMVLVAVLLAAPRLLPRVLTRRFLPAGAVRAAGLRAQEPVGGRADAADLPRVRAVSA